ncbi:MAG: phosphotransferase family protein [Alphaproteobacteria bacterium]|nr:phosphotransferase family protein [Alphaproteobacteria bacterium]
MSAAERTAPIGDPAFQAWLGRQLGMRGLEITGSTAPSGGGWSSETWLVRCRDGAAGAERRVVVRLAPRGPAMFPHYDLRRQIACMRALEDVADCPVPAILGEDSAGSVIGRPLYVMAFVEGAIPADDRPTFFEAGFLADARDADRRRFHEALIRALAALHRAPVSPDLRQTLARGGGGTALGRELAWLREVFAWGGGAAPQPAIGAAFERLAATLPGDDTSLLLWGDARPANVVVRDFVPAALLDFELGSLGPPELDVFWLIEMNRMRSRGRLPPGYLDERETIEAYETLSGRSLRHAGWYTLFSAAKVAVLMLRHLKVRAELGDMPTDHPVMTDNVATRRLEALLEETTA